MPDGKQTLRDRLRSGTAREHALLDRTIGALDLANPDEYAAFLTIQHEGRAPVEAWLRGLPDPEFHPPATIQEVEADLRDLGRVPLPPPSTLSLPDGEDVRQAAPGVAWTLAGSAIGNRHMLKRLEAGASDLPRRFLSDERPLAFWKQVRPMLERPATADSARSALAGAQAVFALFAAAANRHLARIAA